MHACCVHACCMHAIDSLRKTQLLQYRKDARAGEAAAQDNACRGAIDDKCQLVSAKLSI